MRKIREVLRLKYEQGRSHRQIAASCGIGLATVSEYVRRARDSGVGWVEAQQRSDAEIEAQLFPKAQYGAVVERAAVDFGWVHRELRRTGVTLQLLWSEYVQSAQQRGELEPYQYSQFCALYTTWRGRVDLVMRQVHRAGEKAFIDYSGKRPAVADARTGEVREVELFVMVLGASNYTFAEATRTQKVADFTGSIARALEFFGRPCLTPPTSRSPAAGSGRPTRPT